MNHIIIFPLYFFLGVFFSACFFDKRSRQIIKELREQNKLLSCAVRCAEQRINMFERDSDRYRNEVIKLKHKIYNLENEQEKEQCQE